MVAWGGPAFLSSPAPPLSSPVWIARILLPAVTFTIFKSFRCSSYQSFEDSDGDDGDSSSVLEWYLTVDHSISCGITDDDGFTTSPIYQVIVYF